MKNNKKFLRAFSLVELSATLVIIGIGIASITMTNSLLIDMRINSAESLTKSSPVRTIKGLSLWLEAATLDSFKNSERESEAQITTWKDINPQATKKYFALTSPTTAITYKENSDINNLPAIYFSGSSSSAKLTLSKTTSISDAVPIISPDNAFTFFVVSKLDSDAGSLVTLFDNGFTGGFGYKMSGASGSRYRRVSYSSAGNIDSTASDGSHATEIVTVTYSGNSSQNTTMRVNGQNVSISASAIDAVIPNTAMYIGNSASGGSPWQGYIGEIILYKKVLNESQINKIENYLRQKFRVKF